MQRLAIREYQLTVCLKPVLSAANKRNVMRQCNTLGLKHEDGKVAYAAARTLSMVKGVREVRMKWLYITPEGKWINGRKQRGS